MTDSITEQTRRAAAIMKIFRTNEPAAVGFVTVDDQLEAARWRVAIEMAEFDASIEEAVAAFRASR